MAATPALFGVRHHGPGSAARLLEALETLQPQALLLEGPSDLTELLPFLGHPALVPPVALLAYAAEAPERALFLPFAEFSPEFQAVRWALERKLPVRFIDLPAADRLALPPETLDEPPAEQEDGAPEAAAPGAEAAAAAGDEAPESAAAALQADPLGSLAAAAGFEDGESWWRELVEENPAPGEVFAAVASAMAALRAEAGPPDGDEAAREAQMRLEIAAAAAEFEQGSLAVVCGAWHVPALAERRPPGEDRALLRHRPRVRIKATLTPWTAPRLCLGGGYGAGVVSPAWYLHLWRRRGRADARARWLAGTAALLRRRGQLVSTAGLIEAERLAVALAALRERSAPGLEELRDATVACLCHGQRQLWLELAPELLVGSEVGSVPPDAPLSPLLADLQRRQTAARLKPEALDRTLPLDLRSASGLRRSTLLHQLDALEVPWGRLIEARGSRGTFRERWTLRWEPEFAVRLAESLTYGTTVAEAAAGRLQALLQTEGALPRLAKLVGQALTAQLPAATAAGLERLDRVAARTSDCHALLAALPPLAQTLRYGRARAMDLASLAGLLRRLALQAALALPQAARNLDAEAARSLRAAVLMGDRAIALAELPEADRSVWWQALQDLRRSSGTEPLLAGLAVRLLLESAQLTEADCVGLLDRWLSPAIAATAAAGYFEGFFADCIQRLLHDAAFRQAVDGWVCRLPAQDFDETLPMLCRVFGRLDSNELRQLRATLFQPERADRSGGLSPTAAADWAAALPDLLALLQAGTPE